MARGTRPVANLTYTTAIAVIPPQENWAAIQAIRQQHDSKFRRWMPHITLIYPFRPVDEFPLILEPLTAAIAKMPAFDVILAEFKTFRHRRGYTIWLKPEPQDGLTMLYETIPEVVLGERPSPRGNRFQPHLSVGQVQGKEQMERLVGQLQATWKPMTFKVDRVSLIWRRDPPDDVFRIADKIPLT